MNLKPTVITLSPSAGAGGDADAAREQTALEGVVEALDSGTPVRAVDDEFVLLSQHTPEAWGLRPRSKEQRFALELLLDPAVSVVALDGRAELIAEIA